MLTVVLRPATMDDLDDLMALYTAQASDVLPPPTLKDLTAAIEDGRSLLVKGPDGKVLACSALVSVTSASCLSYVGELTGTFVDTPLRRGKPVSLQTILLGLRVVHHAVQLGEVIPPGSNSLITVVRKGNGPSLANVQRAGFVACPERPEWLRYDELSWHGAYVEDEWEYFRATAGTAQHLAATLVAHGLLDGRFEITTASGPVEIRLRGFKELSRGKEDLVAIAKGDLAIALSELPDRLVYAKRRAAPDHSDDF